MKYMMLISLGPEARDFESLSQEEQQQIYAGWKAINETPGVTPGQQLQAPETATTVRARTARRSPPMARTSRPRRRSTATSSTRARTSTRRSRSRRGSRPLALGGAIEIRPLAQW